MTSLKIIDTGDFLILGLDKKIYSEMELLNKLIPMYEGEFGTITPEVAIKLELHKKEYNLFNIVEDLYNYMEIPVKILETPYELKDGEFKIITKVCGKSIINYYGDKTLKYQQLLIDIPKFLENYKTESYWKERQEVQYRNTISFQTESSETIRESNENYIESNENNIESYEKDNLSFEKLDTGCDMIPGTYVLYNTLYNIALVIGMQQRKMKSILENFPEFVEIYKVHDFTQEKVDLLKKLFDLKSYRSQYDFDFRVKSFLNSYFDETRQQSKEKEDIFKFISRKYDIIKDDNDNCISENDILDFIYSNLPELKYCIYKKKRIINFLKDYGIKTKFTKNGLAFYGLKEKNFDDTISYEELVKNRETL
jgi:hypothetical protein